MKNTHKVALVFKGLGIIFTAICAGITVLHMYLVYMGGQYINSAKQTEEEIYAIRNEIITLASSVGGEVDTYNVTASHIVIAEPMTVSSAAAQ